MQNKIVEKYFFFGILLATFIFTFFIFKPFWIVMVLGVSFSIVLHPIHEWFNKKHCPKWISSLLTVLIFTAILCGPLLGIGVLVFDQSESLYNFFLNNNDPGPFLDSIGMYVNKFLPTGVTFDINEKVGLFVSYLSNNIASIFTATVSAFFSFILMLLIIFYFLKDGGKWKKTIVSLSPLSDKDDEKIIDHLSNAVNAIIKGYLLVALFQGILMGLGLWIFDVPNPALWGVVAAVSSLLPTIGTAMVSIPAIIFLLIAGNTTSAIGLLVWSALIVGMIDNFLSPLIVGRKIDISPLVVLFSVLGGISLLGPVGVLLGPLIVSFLYTLLSIYRKEFNQNAIF